MKRTTTLALLSSVAGAAIAATVTVGVLHKDEPSYDGGRADKATVGLQHEHCVKAAKSAYELGGERYPIPLGVDLCMEQHRYVRDASCRDQLDPSCKWLKF